MEATADSRSIIQSERNQWPQRQRQTRQDNTDPSTIREGFQPISVPHLVSEEGQDKQTHLNDEKQLQIRVQTNPSTGVHGREGMHVHQQFPFGGLEDDFRGVPNPSLWSDILKVFTDLANDLV